MSLLSGNGMLTTKEVSEMTGVSSATLAAWRRSRQHIPFYKIGKIVKYKKEDVEAVEAGEKSTYEFAEMSREDIQIMRSYLTEDAEELPFPDRTEFDIFR